MQKSKFKMTIQNAKILAIIFLVLPSVAFAFEIKDLPNFEITNDILISPGKVEVFLNPGETVAKNILIANRTGKELEISIETEDFTGSDDPQKALVLLGNEKGTRSLKDYIKPEIKEFTLSSGQQISLSVKISIPEGTEPGGLYGAVFASARFAGDKESVNVVSRLGSLFFVKVGGESFEDGWLKKFDTKMGKKFFENGQVSFEILFENMGNVHLLPHGVIEINNMLGRRISSIDIDPWFVMPDSLRAREIKWSAENSFGRYKAHLKINRGYGDIADEAVVTFWILPWKAISAVIIMLALAAGIIRQFLRRFEARRK